MQSRSVSSLQHQLKFSGCPLTLLTRMVWSLATPSFSPIQNLVFHKTITPLAMSQCKSLMVNWCFSGVHRNIKLSVCLSVCLSVSVSLPVCLSVCLSVCLPACLPVCLSACLSVHLSVCAQKRQYLSKHCIWVLICECKNKWTLVYKYLLACRSAKIHKVLCKNCCIYCTWTWTIV